MSETQTTDMPAGTQDGERRLNMIEAINDALDVSMGRDDDVVVMGEDVGYFGGVFRCTAGLQDKYGKTRGVAALCIGGGEATAMAVELV